MLVVSLDADSLVDTVDIATCEDTDLEEVIEAETVDSRVDAVVAFEVKDDRFVDESDEVTELDIDVEVMYVDDEDSPVEEDEKDVDEALVALVEDDRDVVVV